MIVSQSSLDHCRWLGGATHHATDAKGEHQPLHALATLWKGPQQAHTVHGLSRFRTHTCMAHAATAPKAGLRDPYCANQ